MTAPWGNRLSICPLRFKIAPPIFLLISPVPRSIETLGEAILNLSGQIDLPITLETSHYLFNNNICPTQDNLNHVVKVFIANNIQ